MSPGTGGSSRERGVVGGTPHPVTGCRKMPSRGSGWGDWLLPGPLRQELMSTWKGGKGEAEACVGLVSQGCWGTASGGGVLDLKVRALLETFGNWNSFLLKYSAEIPVIPEEYIVTNYISSCASNLPLEIMERRTRVRELANTNPRKLC